MANTKRLLFVLVLSSSVFAFGQTQAPQQQPSSSPGQPAPVTHGRSAKGDIGSGSGDIGKGAGKGAGSLAKGTGEGAADVVTLHPVEGAGAIGRGGVSAGKHVGVGAAKGTGKIAKGTGKAIKKIF